MSRFIYVEFSNFFSFELSLFTSRVQFEMKEYIFMDIYKISTLYFLFYCFFTKIINGKYGNSIHMYVYVRMS